MRQGNYSGKDDLPSAEITELQRHDEAAPGLIEQMPHFKMAESLKKRQHGRLKQFSAQTRKAPVILTNEFHLIQIKEKEFEIEKLSGLEGKV